MANFMCLMHTTQSDLFQLADSQTAPKAMRGGNLIICFVGVDLAA